jgi:hypothetical protein
MAFLKTLVLLTLMLNTAFAAKEFRNFWEPYYHGLRLNYCRLDCPECGLPVASKYCQMLGYEKADKAIIDYNAGLTRFLFMRMTCKGWECNSFKLIRCVGKVSHNPPEIYHYTLRRFVFPRFENYRVDWCYDGKTQCGKRPAYSFCRRLGFKGVKYFKKQEQVPATKAIGNQRLCFGNLCKAYSEIVCHN